MNFIIPNLRRKIRKIEKETVRLNNLEEKLNERILENHRKTILCYLKKALEALEIKASRRTTLELYIYADYEPRKVFYITQNYSFKFLTLQEIENKILLDVDYGIKDYWNSINRLTTYNEFKKRTVKLVKYLEECEIDKFKHLTTTELLYMILGDAGELLEEIGYNKNESITDNRINQIIKEKKDFLNMVLKI